MDEVAGPSRAADAIVATDQYAGAVTSPMLPSPPWGKLSEHVASTPGQTAATGIKSGQHDPSKTQPSQAGRPQFGRPPSSIDLVVVGASPAGLLCAIRAARAGARVVLVETDRTDGDAARALPGWLTPLQAQTPHDIRLLHGDPAVRDWATQIQRATDVTRQLAAELGVPIEDQDFGATTMQGHWAFELRFVARALRVGGFTCEFSDDSGLPFSVRPELIVPGGAVIDPQSLLDRLSILAKDCGVVGLAGGELSRLLVRKGIAKVEFGATSLRAPRIVLASSRPLADRAALRFRTRAQTWHLVAMRTERVPRRELQLIDRPHTIMSRYRDSLIIGQAGGTAVELIDWLSRRWPNAMITHGWSTTVQRSVDGLPLVGSASLVGDTVLTASALGGWPLITGMAAGLQLADVALGRTPSAQLPWRPQRLPTGHGLSKRIRSVAAGATPGIVRLNTPGRRH